MKILWHSVAPWVATGYGQQTGTVTPLLAKAGHVVAISAFYGLQGGMSDYQGIPVYPSYSASYGRDVVVSHALHHFGAAETRSFREASTRGIVITLCDVWALDPVPMLDGLAVAAWCPIDHDPVPPGVIEWFGNYAAVPIAMSRFGERQLAEHGLPSLYVPHGVDTDLYSPGDQAEARDRCGLPADAFIVAMVAANVGRDGARKAFGEQLMAFAELRKHHPDAVLVLHTDVDSPVGVRLRGLIEQFPDGSILYTDQYAYRKGMSQERVRDIYRAADLVTNASWGEGFGLPIVEAQACGRPVVVTDATSMPELCGAGWKVPYDPLWHDSQGSWAARPRVGALVDAYLDAYDLLSVADQRAEINGLARSFGVTYDARAVFDVYWRPALDMLAAGLAARRQAVETTPATAELPEQVVRADGLLWLERGPRSDDSIGWSEHEHTLTPHLEALTPPGSVVLDVGAHVGHWALRLARRAARVIAVEANPSTAATLRRHIALNGIENVTVIELAAWDSHTMLRLDDPNHQHDGGSTRTIPEDGHKASPDDPTVIVPALPLDDSDALAAALDDAGRLDLVQLDVEGADLHVLRGLAGTLKRYRPALVVEGHHIYGYYRLEELHETLAALGYRAEGKPLEYLGAVYFVCHPIAEEART